MGPPRTRPACQKTGDYAMPGGALHPASKVLGEKRNFEPRTTRSMAKAKSPQAAGTHRHCGAGPARRHGTHPPWSGAP